VIGVTQISLCNPTSGNWDDFIRENCETAKAIATNTEVVLNTRTRLREVRKVPRMVRKNGAVGRRLVLCGAGPSLAEHWPHYLGPDGISRMNHTDVWACNSALTWLHSHGAYVTHGFGIDQTEGLLREWEHAPPAHYLIASTVDPRTAKHLVALGRPITWFHNYVGSATEGDLYRTIWPSTVMVGDGLNSVNRAICLAQFMGYKHITCLGTDCALGPGDVMHANGDGPEAHGATSVIMENHPDHLVDGRIWRTKPDMLFSAASLARMAAKGYLTLVGDILPNALLKEAHRAPNGINAYLDSIARLGRMVGAPHPGGKGSGLQAPRGRNMQSALFTVTARVAAS
jgi:hypothetical protein